MSATELAEFGSDALPENVKEGRELLDGSARNGAGLSAEAFVMPHWLTSESVQAIANLAAHSRVFSTASPQ